MRYILQEFEDTFELKDILEKMDLEYSLHKVIPFIGELLPDPHLDNKDGVIMFGSYSLRHYADKHNVAPGVFAVRPYIHEKPWNKYCLNKHNKIISVNNLLSYQFEGLHFVRPVDDSKSIAGQIMNGDEIENMVKGVMSLQPEEYISGYLTPETELMICPVYKIVTEWRTWVIDDKVVTYSRYKMGSRVVYHNEIDDDALNFTNDMVKLNPGYAKAYCLDVCRTDDGKMHILETNCMNAAGFYAAEKYKIIEALEKL